MVAALDGQQGIDQAAAILSSIVMMDVMMPNVNGMQALEPVKAHEATRDIPVIMLSANDDPHTYDESYAARSESLLS